MSESKSCPSADELGDMMDLEIEELEVKVDRLEQECAKYVTRADNAEGEVARLRRAVANMWMDSCGCLGGGQVLLEQLGMTPDEYNEWRGDDDSLPKLR